MKRGAGKGGGREGGVILKNRIKYIILCNAHVMQVCEFSLLYSFYFGGENSHQILDISDRINKIADKLC